MWKFSLLQNKYFLFISHISVKEISEDSSNYLLARLTFRNPLPRFGAAAWKDMYIVQVGNTSAQS